MADIYGSEIYDIPRQSSQCRVLVYSHISEGTGDSNFPGAVNCSGDVIECSVSKATKSEGNASFTLVPRVNYLNHIYPNDYVNIYFDPGDGRGFIRTFFGFVDRIERTINVDQNGASVTRYAVTCTDFTKAFNCTNIYFNPSLVDRGDFSSQYFRGNQNLAGATLMSKGVQILGTPAMIVMSLVHHLLGMGSQFTVPRTYPDGFATDVEVSRKLRFKGLLNDLKLMMENIENPEQLKDLIDKAKEAQQKSVAGGAEEKPSVQLVKDAKNTSVSPSSLASVKAGETASKSDAYIKFIQDNPLQAEAGYQGGKLIFNPPGKQSLLDLVDFRFFETNAIHGAVYNQQIWQSQGPLWSIMNTWANGDINELFCDLRPLGENEKQDLRSGNYLKTSDELYANTDAVRYVPAMVFREYPWATVESIVPPVGIEVGGSKEKHTLPPIPIGGFNDLPVWPQQPGKSGRITSTIESLNVFDKNAKATKHLDAVTISVKDIISERLGRSDADAVNLIEIYTDLGIGSVEKFFDNDIQPISTPVSILRDGLRVRSFATKFAMFPAGTARDEVVGGMVDDFGSRLQVVRWVLMMDNWYQHSKEYLNGTINTRAFPEIRVGYRLDIRERNESYYVEGVTHNWTFTERGGMLTSSFAVSRGQRNDPFPVYVTPALGKWGGFSNRNDSSRLALYFNVRDPEAVTRASMWQRQDDLFIDEQPQSYVDVPSEMDLWSDNKRGYLKAEATPKADAVNLKEGWQFAGRFMEELQKRINEKALQPGSGLADIVKAPNGPAKMKPSVNK